MNRTLLLSSILPVGLSAFAQQTKPNILVIIADDMAATELGCYGGQNVTTPNIDRLATQGIRMTNNYASCAMSVPIRASMYTGLYPARHGSYQNHKATYAGTRSVTHYMSELGYRVGRAGKDHPVNQPQIYGFEKIPGFVVGCTVSHPAVSTPDGISEFMRRSDDQPFCLFVCSINSHMPWDAGDASEFDPDKVVLPPNCVDTRKTRRDFCDYLAEIRLFDNEVGMTLNALKESGKEDNTLVILLSEQGPQMPFGKWTCYHYGQSSAMIVRYPGHVAAGTESDALVQYEDILPTMIEAAGGQKVDNMDGISQLSVFEGKTADNRQWVYGMHNNNPEGPVYPIRSIQDKRWKLIENLCPDSSYYEKHMMAQGDNMWQSWLTLARTDEHAAWLSNRFVHRPAVEFYDLQNDRWELRNLADDPQYKERIELMRKELHRWMEQQGDRGVLMDGPDAEDASRKTPKAISSYEELNTLLRGDLQGNFYLTRDIQIPAGTEWVPIGAANSTDAQPERFKGILDGKGHVIKGININTECNFKGLFGRIEHATIRNLTLEDVSIKGATPTGGVTGAMIGASTIEDVKVSGSIQGDSEAGGITGRVARDPSHTGYNTIRNCSVRADVRAANAGGIVGFMHTNTGAAVARLDLEGVSYTGNQSSAVGNTNGNTNIKQNKVKIKKGK